MKIILTLSLTLLLSACASIQSATGGPGLKTIPVGSVLKLNQPLTIPARRARTGVQFGKAAIGVDQWQPYCEFLVNTIAKTATTLPAGDYRITKVRRAEIPYAGVKPGSGKMVASSSESAAWPTQVSGAGYSWLYKTTFSLESDVHPDIRQLECGNVFGTGYEARHITIREFEILAGDVMTLQVVEK